MTCYNYKGDDDRRSQARWALYITTAFPRPTPKDNPGLDLERRWVGLGHGDSMETDSEDGNVVVDLGSVALGDALRDPHNVAAFLLLEFHESIEDAKVELVQKSQLVQLHLAGQVAVRGSCCAAQRPPCPHDWSPSFLEHSTPPISSNVLPGQLHGVTTIF